MKIIMLVIISMLMSFGINPAYSFKTESLKFNTKNKKVWSDGKVGVIVSKIEQATSLSDTLIKMFYRFPNKAPIPTEGYEFVSVHLIIEHITAIHLVSFGGRGDELSSLNVRENNYELHSWQANGIRFSDINDIRSPSEFIAGSLCVLIFEIPINHKPKHINFIYYYKEDLKEKLKKPGIIEINEL